MLAQELRKRRRFFRRRLSSHTSDQGGIDPSSHTRRGGGSIALIRQEFSEAFAESFRQRERRPLHLVGDKPCSAECPLLLFCGDSASQRVEYVSHVCKPCFDIVVVGV